MAGDNKMYSNAYKAVNDAYSNSGAQEAMRNAIKNSQTKIQIDPDKYNKYLTTPKDPDKDSSSSISQGTYDAYANYLAQIQAQRRQAAYDAYNNAVSRIDSAYNSAANNYANIYNNGASTLNGSYNNSANKVNNQAKDALKEAYVNKMLSQKNLSQQLAAQGISGGASESAMAGLINNYGNSRNSIQNTWDQNLADLEQTYNTNLSNLYSAYQSQMAALDNQRASALNSAEQALANLEASNAGSLASALLNNPSAILAALNQASGNMANWTGEDAVATNLVNLVNTQQGNDQGSVTDWAKWKAYLEGAGATNEEKLGHLVYTLGIEPNQAVNLANNAYKFG